MDFFEYLQKGEKNIEKYFNNIQIISEVQLPIETYELIIKNFKKILSVNNDKQTKIINSMWSFSPKTCLTLTVYYAIYNYDGNFWGQFKEAISLNNDSLWKMKFLEQLNKENLISFDTNSNQKFINNILGHAGIPKNNIDSFIKSILMPAVNYHLDESEIVAAIKRNKTFGEVVKSYGLYKSVKDFISLDTEVSNSFIGRCIEVWREHERPFTQKYKFYLPDHVLSAFDHYVDSGTFPKFQDAGKLSRPILFYSPEHQNIYVNLPSQRFKLDKHEEVVWVIRSDESEEVIDAQKARSPENNEVEFHVHKMNGEYPLQPQTDYEVILLIDDEVKGLWNFFLQDVVLFNGKSLEQERKDNVSIKELVFLVHENHKGIIEAGLNNYFSKPLFGRWDGYYEMEVNISKKDILHFPGKIIQLSPSKGSFILQGETWNDIKTAVPLYREVPNMLIKKEIIDQESDLESWKIRLTHKWMNKSARTSLKEALEVSQLSDEGYYKINLDHLMDEVGASFGNILISLTGMLGRDQRTEFVYLDKDDFEIRVVEDFKKEIFIRTVNVLEFSISTNHEVNIVDSKTKVISIASQEPVIRGVLVNKMNNESVDIKMYSSIIYAQIKCGDNYFTIGEKVDKTVFRFSGSSIILDLENPRLQTISDSVTVTIYEHLKNEERVSKKYSLKIGRKHSIDLSYFESINNTYSTRILMLKIEEIKFEEKIVMLETEWKVNSVSLVEEKDPILKWSVSFAPEKVKINIWKLDDFSEPIISEILDGNNHELILSGLIKN